MLLAEVILYFSIIAMWIATIIMKMILVNSAVWRIVGSLCRLWWDFVSKVLIEDNPPQR